MRIIHQSERRIIRRFWHSDTQLRTIFPATPAKQKRYGNPFVSQLDQIRHVTSVDVHWSSIRLLPFATEQWILEYIGCIINRAHLRKSLRISDEKLWMVCTNVCTPYVWMIDMEGTMRGWWRMFGRGWLGLQASPGTPEGDLSTPLWSQVGSTPA